MKTLKLMSGIVGLILLFSTLTSAETDRNLLLKRWKIVKHTKSNKDVVIHENDFIQLGGNGVFEQAHNTFYSKGTWYLNEDEITVNLNGEHIWKISYMDAQKMVIQKGIDELMELELMQLPEQVNKDITPTLNYIYNGKWKPNVHQRNDVALPIHANDIIKFFVDGTYEKVSNGKYSKGNWTLDEANKIIRLDNTAWNIESLSAIFMKVINQSNPKEFMIYAKTR